MGGRDSKLLGRESMYQVPLLQFINKDHEFYKLAERINLNELEQDLSLYYCVDNGRPSILKSHVWGNYIILSGNT